MARARKVALLGNSVVTSSLASTLRCRPGLEVIQFGATPDVRMRLRAAHPDAIILCERPNPPDLIFRLLGEYPGIPVIDADVDGDRMVVLSGRQSTLRTEGDLLKAIGHPRAKRRTKASPAASDLAASSPMEEE